MYIYTYRWMHACLRQVMIDELPSLDPELASSLAFLKTYDGDVEADLCLTFSVDTEEFGAKHGPSPSLPPRCEPPALPLSCSAGARSTVDLCEGGRVVPVTKENRMRYAHLMADYRLNRQAISRNLPRPPAI